MSKKKNQTDIKDLPAADPGLVQEGTIPTEPLTPDQLAALEGGSGSPAADVDQARIQRPLGPTLYPAPADDFYNVVMVCPEENCQEETELGTLNLTDQTPVIFNCPKCMHREYFIPIDEFKNESNVFAFTKEK